MTAACVCTHTRQTTIFGRTVVNYERNYRYCTCNIIIHRPSGIIKKKSPDAKGGMTQVDIFSDSDIADIVRTDFMAEHHERTIATLRKQLADADRRANTLEQRIKTLEMACALTTTRLKEEQSMVTHLKDVALAKEENFAKESHKRNTRLREREQRNEWLRTTRVKLTQLAEDVFDHIDHMDSE